VFLQFCEHLFPSFVLWTGLVLGAGCVYNCLEKAKSGGAYKLGRVLSVPLTECVEFKTVLQRGDRVQVPKLVRWEYKLESTQTLRVSVWATGTIGGWETFYSQMDKSGRITVPRLIQRELLRTAPGLRSLVGEVVHVQLEPT